ncbi:hypothetical protein B0H21DRAFT_881323 [Amylocystis lapponica]|nr:hypothetical protein B0H21DRAFT_881323 [Amylocystis lapponica]
MADMDVFAAMGIAGFGKKQNQRLLDPKRFEKNRREDAIHTPHPPSKDDVSAAPTSSSSAHPEAPKSVQQEPEYDPDEMGPPPSLKANDFDEGEPEFDASDDDEIDQPQFPVTHELMLKDHTKVVSALTLDPSGARVLSGSHDYDCKLWDFGGMDWRCKPFKTWEPAGTYYIHDLKYSNDGQQFLVISGTTQAKLYDRDGEEQAIFVKGDPYIRDMKNTAGHVAELTSCAWHPYDSQTFITSSMDSTIRIWDVENKRKQKTVIVVKSKERGARTKVTACAYSPDSALIGGACIDGALHMWQTKSNFVRPSMTIEGAHTKGTESGSVVFSVDGRTVLTRGGDDTVKIWDLRAFKKPLATHSGLATLYPTTNAIFSPDDKHVVTGAGATSKGSKGRLMFLRKDNLESVKELEVDTTPVKVFWHSKINQIVTGLANGQICVLYSPLTSLNGAKLPLNKGPPRKVTIEDMSDALSAPAIITPHALPMFRDGENDRGTKRKREKDRMDPRKSRRPELPVTGPGRGGRVGASATQHVVQNLVRDTTRDEDPREALLKLAEKDDDPVWTAAWRANQPKPVFAKMETEEDKEEDNSPLVDSPATPVDNSPAAEVKIDVDFDEQESDVRHEPVTMKVTDASSVLPQVGTPADPATIPIEPPKGTPPPPAGELLEDVRMAEEPSQEPLQDKDTDVPMDSDSQSLPVNGAIDGQKSESRAATPLSASIPAVASSEITVVDPIAASSPYPNNTIAVEPDDDEKPPPAKRARKHSDAERASLANTGTPPPPSVSPEVDSNVPLPSAGSPTFSTAQWRFCTSTIRTLRRLKEAGPFLQPVDVVALNIPHYLTIIKHPMDLATIDKKLSSSNPAKPDPNSANPRYYHAHEFIADVRLIFSNCLTFNGPDHPVSQMGKRVEAVFDKQVKQLPVPDEPKPVPVKKVATPPPPPPPPVPPKKTAARRPSAAAVPVIRRNDENVGRPKREIHPPPPKDLPYSDAPKKTRKAKAPKNDANAEQLKFCERLLKDLHSKKLWNIANAFYEPVDWVKMDIPSYPKIVKRPMDLSTIKRKLTTGEYSSAEKFREDFKLMIRNCFAFNPPKNVVHEAGKELDQFFDEKWTQLPPVRSGDASDDEDDEEENSEDERAQMIATMEYEIQNMKNNIESLKKKKGKPEKKEKKKEKKSAAPVASSSKANGKQAKAPSAGRKKGKKPVTDDDVLSFEQKKDLSDTIGKLEGAKLEKVIQIIHEGVPEIRDSTEEIELEIDQLPANVLTKLYNFVIRPMKATATKRARTGKGTGTGGLKRKSMDEDVEAAKIRALEARIKLFEQGGRGSGGGVSDVPPADDSEHSSAESSSESSASDSE